MFPLFVNSNVLDFGLEESEVEIHSTRARAVSVWRKLLNLEQ